MIPRDKIRSALRRLWLYSEARRAALKGARVFPAYYACAICRTPTREPEVDHVSPCGPTPGSRNAGPEASWDGWISRLFEGELQVLCPACHQRKGARDAKTA